MRSWKAVGLMLILLTPGLVFFQTPIAGAQEINPEWPQFPDFNTDELTNPQFPVLMRDDDQNGLGDEWETTYRSLGYTLKALQDLDGDCLINAGEFAWLTIPLGPLQIGNVTLFPNAPDFDGDNFTDAEEVAYWNDPTNDEAPYFADSPSCPTSTAVGPPLRVDKTARIDPDYFFDPDQDLLFTTHDPDSDNDGLLDGDEVKGNTRWLFSSDPSLPDTDADGITDANETGPDGWGANPRMRDSDSDGIDDLPELVMWLGFGLDPRQDIDGDGLPGLLDADSDDDGLNDGDEVALRTNMTRWDTDGDGMPDGWEVAHALDPLDSADATGDPDGDGLLNAREFTEGTDPRNKDSDNDSLSDGDEAFLYLTDPRTWDTDSDGMPDAWEIDMDFDPRNAHDATEDADDDGYTDPQTGAMFPWTNVREYQYGRPTAWRESVHGAWTGGTLPHARDTDGDGIPDGEEVAKGTPAGRPLADFDSNDIDGDGLSNFEEMTLGLDPLNADSDGDGLCDGGFAPACKSPGIDTGAPGERNGFGSNPWAPNRDTDGDGLDDWAEAELMLRANPDPDGDGILPILDPDSDNDTIPDGDETDSDPLLADTDGDGLDDARERFLGTSPTNPDHDGDGVLDGDEVRDGTDPFEFDSDGDGAGDGAERDAGSNPWSYDSDGDEMTDGWEIQHGLNPVDASDRHADPDADGLDNLQEFGWGSDPHDRDTDFDGITDGREVLLGLHPARDDRLTALADDGDGLDAITEAALGTDPWTSDSDSDGLSDSEEAGFVELVPDPTVGLPGPRLAGVSVATLSLESDPTIADTDGDGVPDGKERARWLQYGPDAVRTSYRASGNNTTFISNLREADADGDGLDDGQEWALGTDPRYPDTDDDGASDRDEVMGGSNPRDPTSLPGPAAASPAVDTDGDGLMDHEEREFTLTDPNNPDTDDDGLDDGAELMAWMTRRNTTAEEVIHLLLDPDADRDGVPDGDEFATAILPRGLFFTTDPDDPDTDGDGLLDGQESRNDIRVITASRQEIERTTRRPAPTTMQASWSPALVGGPTTNPWSVPETNTFIGAWGTLVVAAASPGPANSACPDGRPSPQSLDSDGDGLSDGYEWPADAPARAHPCYVDSDGDGIPDTFEVRRMRSDDIDGDGIPPALDHDSDGDGLSDGEEDASRNGFFDGFETDLLDQDTDDDGLTDQQERAMGFDARNPDSDSDGLPDGLEERVRIAPDEIGGVSPWTDKSAMMTCGPSLSDPRSRPTAEQTKHD